MYLFGCNKNLGDYMNGKELLIDGIEKIGLEISEEQANQFMKYYEMLIETNKVMNLTAITELVK